MALKTKYISLDEFQEYFGIDLREELGSDALAFLKRIEDRMSTFIDSNFNRNVDMVFPFFTDYQKEHYKLALLEQAIYVFKNGDISVDSGLDIDKGEIVSRGVIKSVIIAPNAVDNLRLCGIWNRNMRRANAYGFRYFS